MKNNTLFRVVVLTVAMMTVTGCGVKSDAVVKEVEVNEMVAVQEEKEPVVEEVESLVDEEEQIKKIEEELAKEQEEEEAKRLEEESKRLDEEKKAEETYENKKSEVIAAVDECKSNKDINGALKVLYDARVEYPEDEFFEEFQKELFDCQAGYVNENISVISKKGCTVGLNYVDLENEDSIREDFSLNFGGGNIVLNLAGQYKSLDIAAFLSNQAPTKGLIDIDIIGDGVVIDSIKGFDVYCGKIERTIDVTGVENLEISAADHTHAWVGEAAFSKPDAECHFTFRAYTDKAMEWK